MASKDKKDHKINPELITFDRIESRVMETEMQESYLDYAMSVIVARALPDVRDGMKPVHRRILYSMGEIGLRSSSKYKKCAAVVGDVLGKYHPHGDVAIYDTLARMAQDFTMRYPLADGQGNFGSIDGDRPAAMRYTECRLASVADEMLVDLDKETVDFIDNYDGTKQEPVVLPARVPQLLMNGTVGIAVGMATSIPPHNLHELADAIVALVDKPESTVDDLMEFVKGPDYPTGGIIYNPEEIKRAYATGKGSIVTRGVAEIGEGKRGFQIVITELPYVVQKSTLLEKIAELVRDKKIKGISDIRDESDREGIRVVIELKKEAYPKKVLNQLFKMTALQSTFHVNLLALVDGIQPRVLDLKSVLEYFIAHRQDVVTRRTRYELKKAEEREHILQGLKIALDHLDAVISTIRKSDTKEEAHQNLMKQFKLTDVQAQAILEMRLQALAGLERKKVEDELLEKQKLIKELKSILGDPKRVLAIIRQETLDLKTKYKDERRTKISSKSLGKFTDEDLIPNEDVVITMSAGGYIKRQQIDLYRTQKRGGKGVMGMVTKEEDVIERIQVTRNHNDILFFTSRGRVFRQKVYEIPQSSRIAKGTAIVNLIQLAPDETVSGWLIMKEYRPENFFVFVTKKGTVKKSAVSMYQNIRLTGLIAIKLDENDELRFIGEAGPKDDLVIVSQDGQSIRFPQSDLRPMGRSTRGVLGMRLRPNDEVVGAAVSHIGERLQVLVVSQSGLGKRTDLDKYPVQRRGGIGVKTLLLTEKTGKLVGGKLVAIGWEGEMILTSKAGQVIRMSIKGVPSLGRSTQGVRLMRLNASDKVVSFTLFAKDEDKEVEELAQQAQADEKTGGAKPKQLAIPVATVDDSEVELDEDDIEEDIEEQEEEMDVKPKKEAKRVVQPVKAKANRRQVGVKPVKKAVSAPKKIVKKIAKVVSKKIAKKVTKKIVAKAKPAKGGGKTSGFKLKVLGGKGKVKPLKKGKVSVGFKLKVLTSKKKTTKVNKPIKKKK